VENLSNTKTTRNNMTELVASSRIQATILTMRPKALLDAYEFLHQAEAGPGTIESLCFIFGSDNNLPKSNERQVDRIRQRCLDLGIKAQWDEENRRYKASSQAKLFLHDLIETAREAAWSSFGGFLFRKVPRSPQ